MRFLREAMAGLVNSWTEMENSFRNGSIIYIGGRYVCIYRMGDYYEMRVYIGS